MVSQVSSVISFEARAQVKKHSQIFQSHPRGTSTPIMFSGGIKASVLSARRFSTSVCAFQEASQNAFIENSYKELKEGLKYYTTSKDLKPLIYRPKNANTLLGMDIYDEEDGRRIQPKSFAGTMKKSLLTNLFTHSNNYLELRRAQDMLFAFANLRKLPSNKNYIDEEHFQNFLISAARLNKFPHALSHLYRHNRVVAPHTSHETIQLIHVMNGILKLNSKGYDASGVLFKDFVRKMYVPMKQFTEYRKSELDQVFGQNGLTALSFAAALANFASVRPKTKAQAEEKIENVLKEVDVEGLELPSFGGKHTAFSSKNQIEMLILEGIVNGLLKTENARAKAAVAKIAPLVESYNKLAQEQGKKTLYSRVSEESKFGKPEKTEETEEQSEEK